MIAVDAAPSMVEVARAALGERAEVRQAELTALELDEQVDAVFSNAVFHWVRDHDALFAAPRTPRCGPAGGCRPSAAGRATSSASTPTARGGRRRGALRRAPRAAGTGPWNFAGAEETARAPGARRASATCEVWLEPNPVVPEFTEEYLRTVCLGHHLERLPEHLRDDYVRAVAERCGQPVELDYVRLNITASAA